MQKNNQTQHSTAQQNKAEQTIAQHSKTQQQTIQQNTAQHSVVNCGYL